MKLYTITGTPIRENLTAQENIERVKGYYTEVSKLLSSYGIDGFTMYEVNGYWQGKAETSFKIEVAVNSEDAEYIKDICNKLRDNYNQDCVMLTNPDNTVKFI